MLLRSEINKLPISLRNDLHQALIILGGGIADAALQSDQCDVINLVQDRLHGIKQDVINLDNDRLHVTLHDAIKDKSELLAASRARCRAPKGCFSMVFCQKSLETQRFRPRRRIEIEPCFRGFVPINKGLKRGARQNAVFRPFLVKNALKYSDFRMPGDLVLGRHATCRFSTIFDRKSL